MAIAAVEHVAAAAGVGWGEQGQAIVARPARQQVAHGAAEDRQLVIPTAPVQLRVFAAVQQQRVVVVAAIEQAAAAAASDQVAAGAGAHNALADAGKAGALIAQQAAVNRVVAGTGQQHAAVDAGRVTADRRVRGARHQGCPGAAQADDRVAAIGAIDGAVADAQTQQFGAAATGQQAAQFGHALAPDQGVAAPAGADHAAVDAQGPGRQVVAAQGASLAQQVQASGRLATDLGRDAKGTRIGRHRQHRIALQACRIGPACGAGGADCVVELQSAAGLDHR